MDKQAVIEALDKAITKAGDDALNAAMGQLLYSSMEPYAQKQAVLTKSKALRDNLSRLAAPDYDDEVTVAAYLFNYQASHIGLAWAMISEMVRRRQ